MTDAVVPYQPPAQAEVICGARAERCRCGLAAGHDEAVHVCERDECLGSWSVNEQGNMVVHSWPISDEERERMGLPTPPPVPFDSGAPPAVDDEATFRARRPFPVTDPLIAAILAAPPMRAARGPIPFVTPLRPLEGGRTDG